MTEGRGIDDEADALLSRLRLIEEQRLDQRALAYEHLHDELQAALDDGPPRQGL